MRPLAQIEDAGDFQSLREMIESFAQMRPENSKRGMPRFPTAAALAGRLEAMSPDCLLLLESEGFPGGIDEGGRHAGDRGIARKGCIVDFSEGGLQLQFPCEDILRFLSGSTHFFDLRGTRVPILLKWCKHSPQAGRGGVAFVRGSGGRYLFMNLVAGLGEDLVRFLIGGFRQGSVPFSEQGAVFACYSIFYALRLQLLKAVASVNELAESARGRARSQNLPEGLRAEMKALKSRFVRELRTDALPSFFMRPFHDFGCALIGMHEDCVFLESDALAIVKSSILPPSQGGRDPEGIYPGLEFLHGSFLQLRELLPVVFEDARFDLQFGTYSTLITHLESLRDKLIDSISFAASPPELMISTGCIQNIQ